MVRPGYLGNAKSKTVGEEGLDLLSSKEEFRLETQF
jgi:hypothetical protein